MPFALTAQHAGMYSLVVLARATGEIKTMKDHWTVMKLLFQEVQKFAGDTYATAAERKCVTSRHRLRAIGVGDPKPYGNKRRTWDTCYVKYITKARSDYITWGLDPTIDPDPDQLAPGRPATGKEPENYWDDSEGSDCDVDLEDDVGETTSKVASSSKSACSSSNSSKRLLPQGVTSLKRKHSAAPSCTSESSSSSKHQTGKQQHIAAR